jgi:hypothetical protein
MSSKAIKYGCRSSTESSPLALFESFFKNDKILIAKDLFIESIPDINNPESYLLSKTSYIAPDKLEYHLEHLLEDYDPDTGIYKSEKITQVISLAKEIENFFRDEFFESKSLLKKKLDDLIHDKTKRKRCREIIGDIIVRKILPLIKLIESDDKYSGYVDVCKRPVKAIVKFLYRNYSEYTPDQTLYEKIREIFKQSIDDKDLLDESSFDLSVIDALSVSAKKISHRIFSFHEPGIEIPNLKKLLLNPRLSTLDKPVNIFGKVGEVNYALALILRNVKQSRRSLQRSKQLFINKSKFSASDCDTDFYRYPQKHPKEAKIIEGLINSPS